MSDQLYIKYRSFDSEADPTYKSTVSDWFIGWRSYLKHTEIEFPEIYGCISFSATNADGCKCARFKMIDYTRHPKRWKTVLIPVTREQCDLMFAEACRMADLIPHKAAASFGSESLGWYIPVSRISPYNTYYGPNALKYDLLAVSFSFISKRTIWRPDKNKVFCTESVFILLLIAFPDILSFPQQADKKGWVHSVKNGKGQYSTVRILKPDQLTPSLGDKIARNYAERKAA